MGMYSSYCRWLLPEVSGNIALPLLLFMIEGFYDYVGFRGIRNAETTNKTATASKTKPPWIQLAIVTLHHTADLISGFGFVFLYLYNCYGPNQDNYYVLDELSENQKLIGFGWIMLMNFFSVLRSVFYYKQAKQFFDAEELKKCEIFVKQMWDDWFWLVIFLLASTELICGACMIMKHDGMDLSFRWKEWTCCV